MITGFKGLFRKVVDQAQTIQKKVINEINFTDDIIARSNIEDGTV